MARASGRLAEALRLWQAGFDVIPVRPGTKQPLIRWGGRHRTGRLSAEDVRGYWEAVPPPDIGVALRDHIVIDVDPACAPETRDVLERTLAAMTLCARTPRGGIHAWFAVPRPTSSFRPASGIDVQGWGSLVIVPPADGREYINALPIMTVTGDVETWLYQLLADAGVSPQAGTSVSYIRAQRIPKGERNVGLTSAAGALRKIGFRGPRLLALLETINRDACDPPLAPDEVRKIAESIGACVPEPFEGPGYTIREIGRDMRGPPLQYVVKPMIPGEGVTILFGGTGQGKTYIAMGIGCAVQNGIPFLGMPTTPGEVLYLDMERRGRIFQRRADAIWKGLGAAVPLTYIEAERPLQDMIPVLRDECYIRGNVRLIIVDSITIALRGVDVIDAKAMIPILDLLNKLPVPVLGLDHQKRPSKDESYGMLWPFGSTTKEWFAGCVWQVGKTHQEFREGGMELKLVPLKNSFDLTLPTLYVRLEFEGPEGNLDMIRFSLQEARYSASSIGRVLEVMAAVPRYDPWTVPELVGATGLPASTIRYALTKLCADGRVIETKRGRGQGQVSHYELARPEGEENGE